MQIAVVNQHLFPIGISDADRQTFCRHPELKGQCHAGRFLRRRLNDLLFSENHADMIPFGQINTTNQEPIAAYYSIWLSCSILSSSI